ncbi:MAG: hypothetical protein AB7L90_21090 [Hyphomicrobiaceae bacterium]
MLAIEVQQHARRLFEIHGPKAIAEAAQLASKLERQNHDSARDWRRIEAALRQMRGPHES